MLIWDSRQEEPKAVRSCVLMRQAHCQGKGRLCADETSMQAGSHGVAKAKKGAVGKHNAMGKTLRQNSEQQAATERELGSGNKGRRTACEADSGLEDCCMVAWRNVQGSCCGK